jgi:hypothetical protein
MPKGPSVLPSSRRPAANFPSNQVVTRQDGLGDQRLQGELFPIAETEVDGVQMGVLSDGTPYLTMRGLARMCGIDNTSLFKMAVNWEEEKKKPRGRKIQELLTAQGYTSDLLYIKTRGQTAETHAYTDAVCMAVLEYYAFESAQGSSETALRNYRLLARDSFRTFIYKKCHYDPSRHLSDSWKNFHARILLNEQMPSGYFSIFKEIADLVLRMIQQGCSLDHHTVPDSSVGSVWGREWQDKGLDMKFGERIKHPHFYPEWFPQSAVNPVEAWVYPNEALAAFRKWMEEKYLPEKFPNYVAGKVKTGILLESQATKLLQAVNRPKLN